MSQQTFYSLNAWARNRPGDFFDRLSAYSCSSIPIGLSANRATQYDYYARSRQGSSMAQRGEGVASNTSTYDMSVPRTVPSLAGMSASTQLSHSINTDLASEVGVHHILHEDENENLIAPTVERPFVSHCLFRIIGCRKTFDDAEEWKTHVTSHFKLQPVPLSVACQICKKTFQDAAEGEAWSQMLNHIATQHILQGETLVGTNPNYELMHYLYCKGIVTHVELSFLQFEDPDLETGAEHEGGAGSANEPYFVSVSSRRERRMKGRQI